ncbi:RB-associated KRAB zinc finger protein-like [Sabethes cyaneus]|uniref:RB-associated KRAB zinc finger protein-like n=1 Tax=Sabethes cyaneus TaxID=53552 RepID=UPI00237EE7BA|nr:RB-associated KRAB zinc finger protein-like [Sabethes cyaneus]
MDVGQEFEFGSSTASSPTSDELLKYNFEPVPCEIESTEFDNAPAGEFEFGSSTASSPTLDELLNCNFESVPSEIESIKLESIKSWLLQDTGSSTASSPTLEELLKCHFESVPCDIETITTSVAPVFSDNSDFNNNCAAVQQLTSSSSGSYFQPAESRYSGYNIISQPNEQPVGTTEAQVLKFGVGVNNNCATVQQLTPSSNGAYFQPAESSYSGYNINSQPISYEQPVVTTEAQLLEFGVGVNNNCATVQQLIPPSNGAYCQPAECSYSGHNFISQPIFYEQPQVFIIDAEALPGMSCGEFFSSVKLDSPSKPQEEAITIAQPVVAANSSTQLAGCSTTKRRKRNNAKIDYDTNFYCKECNQKFGRVSSWRQHNKSQHTELPFECTKCGKRFGTQTQLSSHELNHTAAKQIFACDYPDCTRRYVHRKDLRRHKQSHEGYQFICNLCGRGSARNDQFLKHMLTHDNNGKVTRKKPKKIK